MCKASAVTSGLIRTALLFIGVPVTLALMFGASLWPLLVAYGAWFGLMFWSARRGGRKTGGKRLDLSAVAFMLFLIFGLPVALASVVATSWVAILIAYAIWFGLLGLWVVQGLRSRRVTSGEATGWPLIGAMFLTMAVVPVLTLLLRLTGLV